MNTSPGCTDIPLKTKKKPNQKQNKKKPKKQTNQPTKTKNTHTRKKLFQMPPWATGTFLSVAHHSKLHIAMFLVCHCSMYAYQAASVWKSPSDY